MFSRRMNNFINPHIREVDQSHAKISADKKIRIFRPVLHKSLIASLIICQRVTLIILSYDRVG